ncbi:Phosphatidylinositol 45-bisphosphate 5-phosphatase INP51 [Spathaspora sp. JA1]|nr:Phosphatidylinositol 45-bisphosphate 5-phosphatase INP51 [Spathaspora sp. JA1]
MKLYLNEKPRTFILATTTHALIIRHPWPRYKEQRRLKKLISSTSKNKKDGVNKVLVEFINRDSLDLTNFREITPRSSGGSLAGFLGLMNVKGSIYLGFITKDEFIASPTINERINRITGVEFYCLDNDEYDDLLTNDENLFQKEREKLVTEYPAESVKKLLSSGSFFYSRQFDVTSNVQERGVNNEFSLIADSDYFCRFQWNRFMMNELMEFRNRLSVHEQRQIDGTGFCITIARGYAKTVNTTINGDEALLTLISKQACLKEGPLFGDWGVDGNGYTSNYVESEMIVYSRKFVLSYVIIRGNVPVYWEIENTKNILAGTSKRIVFPRSFEASQHAFSRHFEILANQFGDVQILNALSQDPKSYKGMLNQEYEQHVDYFNKNRPEYQILYTHIPVTTSRMKKIGYTASNPYDIVSVVSNSLSEFGALLYDNSEQNFIGKQLGVFRINSFDCLSKVDFLGKIINQEVLELAFRDVGIMLDHDVYTKHGQLWEENEQYLSKLTLKFASTSDKLQKSSAKSTTSTMKSHITKKYLSGVVVETKPNELAILKLLGRLQDQTSLSLHNPIHDYVSKELTKSADLYTSHLDITLFASTFNVNGSIYDGDITDWIFPRNTGAKEYDLVFIGLQEIVELNPQQMVNTDVKNKYHWEQRILKCLNSTNTKYMVSWSGQLGGLALLLYVKQDKLKYVSNIECSFKKTGLKGVSANKGGVGVSFKYCNTSFCFVTSHLAAGLTNNEERHANYKTLSKGIQFSKNKRIRNHDIIIWLGDFNYRIVLPISSVKQLIDAEKYGKLFEFDQLNKEMANGETFPFFHELEIKFPPTYKFDNGTKVYDTSEKQRIPAWTDRILYQSRANVIKPLIYNSNQELIFSDHRPVYAMFTITVDVIDHSIKKNLSNQLYETYKKTHGGINDILTASFDYLDLLDDDTVALPAPSSELQKWWLERGSFAKVIINQLDAIPIDGDSMVINPKRPINPFQTSDEPEFISKSELLKMLSK